MPQPTSCDQQPGSYYHWLGAEGEKPRYTYYGNWDFGDPRCKAEPSKFLCLEASPFRGFPIPLKGHYVPPTSAA
jgi:hypothetical protein